MASQEFAVVVRLGLVAACGLAMGGCPEPGEGIFGEGEDPRAFATLDEDGDAAVTQTEFASWGRDQGLLDALLEEGETVTDGAMARTLYTMWNAEGAGISEEEFTNGVRAWFPNADVGAFNTWDLDQSGDLDALEIEAGIPHTELLADWDADDSGDIDSTEVLGGYFEVFDLDRSGEVTEPEWTSGLERWKWDI